MVAAPSAQQATAAAGPPINFRRASIRKQANESSVIWTTGGQNVQQLVAKGYMETLLLPATFDISESNASNPSEDTPWDLMKRITLRDSGGTAIYSLKGYNSFVHSKFLMGHRAWVDQSLDTTIFDGTTFADGVAPVLEWEIPVANNERDLIGMLPNQSDAFKYTWEFEFEQQSVIWGTPGDAAITGTISPYYRYYTIPQQVGQKGQAQENTPPMFGVVHQTIDTQQQMGSAPTTYKVTLPIGKVYRAIALVIRDDGVRANAITRATMKYGDDVSVWTANGQELRAYQFINNGRDMPVGVYILDRESDSGLWMGLDYRRDYIDTRNLAEFWIDLELTGLSGAATVDIISDMFIAPKGITF